LKLEFKQIDLVVRDMEATIAFYRALGLDIPESAIWRTASGAHHVDLHLPNGMVFHCDSEALAVRYNAGWKPPTGASTRTLLTFYVPAREDVDRTHRKLAELGYGCTQPPYDTFWGSRYAIIEDPDGNHVGVMSPPDAARRSAPPDL
jgi:uncharacterized glyoxalase superfamily protein PhnB